MITSFEKISRVRGISIEKGSALWQRFFVLVLMASCVAWIKYSSAITLVALAVAMMILAFAAISVVKFFLSSKMSKGIVKMSDELLPDFLCKPYTIMAALYNEPEVLPQLIENLQGLDYPSWAKRVRIVLEEKDKRTQEAISSLGGLPENFEFIIVPSDYLSDEEGKPCGFTSKPRALNYALESERKRRSLGDYYVIYDAEDVPNPDQLRVAAAAFDLHPEVACFQAELRWFNRYRNWFTRMLAISYATGFSTILPGLSATFGVFPLGGTSNHMRSDVLELVGDYDPYNVTEDADLGAKFRRIGKKVMMLPSVTEEEATVSFKRQVKQSSRWVKGYTATFIAHTRNPVAFFRDFGWWGSICFLVIFGGTHLAMLTAPLFWGMTIWYAITGSSFVQEITPAAVFHLGVLCLLANFAYIWIAMIACLRSDQTELIPWAITLPLYWNTVLFCAAVKAAWEIYKGEMYVWDKTAHGVDLWKKKTIAQVSEIRPAEREVGLLSGEVM